MGMENHGKLWKHEDMQYLYAEWDKGDIGIGQVANNLGRSLPACNVQVTIIRKAILFYEGKDGQTMKDIRK